MSPSIYGWQPKVRMDWILYPRSQDYSLSGNAKQSITWVFQLPCWTQRNQLLIRPGNLGERTLPLLHIFLLVRDQAIPGDLCVSRGKGSHLTTWQCSSKTVLVCSWAPAAQYFSGSYFCCLFPSWKCAKIHVCIVHQPAKESKSLFEVSEMGRSSADPLHLPSLVSTVCSQGEFSGFSSFLETLIMFGDYKGRKRTALRGFRLWRMEGLGQCSSLRDF